MTPRHLTDTSALARLRHTAVEESLRARILGGAVARCSMVDLEVLWSARSFRQLVEVDDERRATFPMVMTAQEDFDRALEVMKELARQGQHRSAPIPDLLIAAVAERHHLTLLHYDEDFDRIARVTGQRAEWVVPRGSVP